MLSRDPDSFSAAYYRLCPRFGNIDYSSVLIPFSHTAYYEREFGPGLMRQFVGYELLTDPGALPDIKGLTNAIEQDLAMGGKRVINLDPGYLTLAKYVLATVKDQSYRLYLGSGIYGEITCNYQHKAWQPNPWAYPDYHSPAYLQILLDLRIILARQLQRPNPPLELLYNQGNIR